MPRASTTTCGISNIRPPNGPLLRAFPTWMWRNKEVRAFVDWLRTHNAPLKPASARGLSWARSLQPLRFDPRRSEISRRGRSRDRARRARALRLPDALAVRSRHLWPRRADRRLPDLRVGSRRRAHRSPAQAPRIRRARRRAVHGCGAERPARRQCRALLSDHVLRLARILESARQPHVRDVEDVARPFMGAKSQGHRLGPQFSHRRCRSDRDVSPAASTISVISAARSSATRVYSIGFGTQQRHRRGGLGLGRADGDQDGRARHRARATSGCCHETGIALVLPAICAKSRQAAWTSV